MFAKIWRQIRPLDIGYSVSKSHARQLFFDRGQLNLVVRGAQSLCKLEKPSLLGFLCLDPGLNEVFNYAICAPVLASGELLDFLVELSGKSYTPAYGPVFGPCGCHK